MKRLFWLVLMASLLSMAPEIEPRMAWSATLVPAEKAEQVVIVRNVTVKEDAVSGELVNQSSRSLRDVQLQIRYSWRWKNEFKPGNDDFGITVYHTVSEEIPPGKAVQFHYKPSSPLASRPDGYFETTVSVAGFTEVIR
jgi:hypothetical protein